MSSVTVAPVGSDTVGDCNLDKDIFRCNQVTRYARYARNVTRYARKFYLSALQSILELEFYILVQFSQMEHRDIFKHQRRGSSCTTRKQNAAQAGLTSELELRMKQVVFLRLTLPTRTEVTKGKDLTWQPSLPPNSNVLAIT